MAGSIRDRGKMAALFKPGELEAMTNTSTFQYPTAPFDDDEIPAATQPLPESFRKKVREVQRRYTNQRRARSIKTQSLRFPQSLADTQTTNMRSHVLLEVKKRLQLAGVDISNIPERFFYWILPRNGASTADRDTLLNLPIFLSNDQLRSMIKMVLSRTWKTQEEGTTIFYVRTFAFTLDEFLEVLQAMFEEGFGAQDTPYVFWELIQDLDPEDKNDGELVVFVRYCGTSGHSSAWGRHVDDLRSKYVTFRTTFLKLCKRLHPHVIEAAEVDELPDATIFGKLHTSQQHLVDLREQALIALFGPSALLNTAKGGMNTRFIAHEADNAIISSLNTSLMQRLPLYTQEFTNLTAINEYALAVQQYTRAHPRAGLQVSSPSIVRSVPIMVTVGSDLTPDMMNELKPWYTGGFEFADISIDIFNSLAQSELGFGAYEMSVVREMYEQHQLPFVDLFPWPSKATQDLSKALEFLRKYLQATQPIIVLTFSTLASSAAIGSFQQPHGIKNTRMTENLGTAVMSKYDENVMEKLDANCCLIIPCIHPGHARRHASRGETVLRLMHMTLAVAWLAMDEAIRVGRNTKLTKREICRQIQANVVAKAGPATDFGSALEKSRIEYLDSHATVLRMSKQKSKNKVGDEEETASAADVPDSVQSTGASLALYGDKLIVQTTKLRWTRALGQLQMICACGVAEGVAKSPTRITQVDRLMALSMGLIRGEKSGYSDEDVQKWLLDVIPDTLYFFAANSTEEIVTETPDLVSIFLPKGMDSNNDAWKDDQKLCHEAISEAMAWILSDVQRRGETFDDSLKNLPRHFQALLHKKDPGLAKSLKMELLQAPEPAELFQENGQQVLVRPPGHPLGRDILVLKWKHDDELYELHNFQIPAGCVPLTSDDPRFLFMVADGLDIRDSSGRSMGTGKDRHITLPVHQLVNSLMSNPLQGEFLGLWERMTGLKVDQVLTSGASVTPASRQGSHPQAGGSLPKSFFAGRQLAMETTVNRLSKDKRIAGLKQNLPFRPGDAGWLIHKFIQHQYPNGGLIDLGNPSMFANSPSVWTHFASFLQLARYYNHPHRANLEAACRMASGPPGPGGAGGGIVTNFIVMMNVLRPPVKQSVASTRTTGGRKTKTVLTVAQQFPANVVMDREESNEVLEDATLQQILGDDGDLVDDDADDDDGGDAPLDESSETQSS
ncbi:hypothetical protein EDD36DRAFT_500098 [Exophiala viscosa]|uniref:Uncharacterized protein n=1 Tax=Exophiala viscosa TaxID=2486360 RepID=A0AAN6DN27_9EURO|nr:hypothetical protein EDD36DRAFT_500098 [Exophiala viscosa]